MQPQKLWHFVVKSTPIKKIISNNLKQDYLAWIIYITNNPELKIKGLQHSLLAQNSDLVFNLDYSASMY